MINEELVCEICGEVFDTEEAMMQHFKDNHMKKKNCDTKGNVLLQLLKGSFKEYSIEVLNDRKIAKAYHIVLTNDKNGTVIQQRYGEFKDSTRAFRNPSTEASLISAISEKIEIIESIKNTVKLNNQLENIECTGFYYGTCENSDSYHFKIKLKNDDMIIEENYYHYEDELEMFIRKCNSYFSEKLEGYVSIESPWGKEYYIDGEDIDTLLETAKRLNKKVRLEILN
jgi:hypothetical protein